MLRGLYGGATMAGGGLALLVAVDGGDGLARAYATGLGLAVAAAAVDVGVRGLPGWDAGAEASCGIRPCCRSSASGRDLPGSL